MNSLHDRLHDRPAVSRQCIRLIRFLAILFVILAVTTILFYPHLFLRFYLVWNVFLAVLPLVFALVLRLILLRSGPKAVIFLTGLLWIVFFPNAPYMVTDLIHLQQFTWYVPAGGFASDPSAWFGLLHLVAGILAGCVSGMLSLYLIHRAVKDRFGHCIGWLFCAAVSCLSGFAIYLGRFLRFNTWDLLTHPLQMLQRILLSLGPDAFLSYLIFAVMTMLLYLMFYFCFHRSKTHPPPSPSQSREDRL